MASSICATSSSVCGANLMVRALSLPGDVLEAVLGDQRQVVALVEDLAVDARVELAEPADLPVLPGHELLVQGRDLDVEVVLGQEEVGGESLDDVAVLGPLEVARGRLVLPVDLVEVQQLRELTFARVSEGHGIALEGGWSGGAAHSPPATRAWRPRFPVVFARDPSSSAHTLSNAIAKTACPPLTRSTTA